MDNPMRYPNNWFFSIVFVVFMMCQVFFPSNTHPSEEDTSQLLKNIDVELDKLSDTIRKDPIGWLDSEIFTSKRTDRYEKEYIELQNILAPTITETAHTVRHRVTTLRTMRNVLSKMPHLLSDSMTIDIYQGKLNHIEFMLLSRRSTISSKLSIWIALFFGGFSLVVAILSFFFPRESKRQHRITNDKSENRVESSTTEEICNVSSDDEEASDKNA